MAENVRKAPEPSETVNNGTDLVHGPYIWLHFLFRQYVSRVDNRYAMRVHHIPLKEFTMKRATLNLHPSAGIALIISALCLSGYLILLTISIYNEMRCPVPPPEKSIADLKVPFKGTFFDAGLQ